MSPLRRLAAGGAVLALVASGTTPPARAAVDPNDPNVVVRRITVPVQGSFSYRDDFGDGYWLLAEDGGVYAFGDAAYRGSPAGTGLCGRPAARRIAASATGKGYWVAAADGTVSAFGDAYDHGSPKAAGVTPNAALLDLVPVPAPPPPPTTTTTTTTTTKPTPSSTTTTTRRPRR